MKIKAWMNRQWHEEEVHNILKATQCVGPKGWLRRWTPETWRLMQECGHTSLDYEQCECSKAEAKE